jgi:tetratricopeptide (TPR) repeat protein
MKSNPVSLGTSVPALTRPHIPVWLLAALLVLVTVALYWPALRYDFVNLDDNVYVTENPYVQSGLTWAGVKWAFSNTQQAAYWAPMMWLSHMLACQLFGLNPWGHHLINVLLHAANVVLVFFLLRQLTGATWRSLFVAALFGWHPLRVESVAWVTERKDVLSACFGLLALIFYVRFAQQQGTRSKQQWTSISLILSSYCWSLFFFALGLMSKPMLVTWPLVMLLLDWWPLGRVTGDGWQVTRVRGLVWEKVPFLALALVMSAVTFAAQKYDDSVVSISALPFDARGANALVSYCRYLKKLFWPSDLAIYYPHPGTWPMGKVALAGGLLLIITALCFAARRRHPFLLMGWLWFVATLLPVIGLVQAGWVAMADRFTYAPSLGVLILAVWGVNELAGRWRYRAIGLSVAGCAAIALCLGITRQQLGCWKDSEFLFRHTLAVAENSYLARNGFGLALDQKGQTDAAIAQFQEAIRLKPDYAMAYNNLGAALDEQGRTDEAIRQIEEAIRLKPDYANAHNNLGIAFLKENRIDEAISQFQEVIRLRPDFAEAYNHLGNTLGRKGEIGEAIKQFEEAIRRQPNFAEAYNDLGIALLGKNRDDAAIHEFELAIRLQPDFADARHNLGIALLKEGRIDEAITQFQETIRLKPDYAEAHNNLGTALGKKGQLDEAISQYQEAVRLKPDLAEARGNLNRALEIKNGPKAR